MPALGEMFRFAIRETSVIEDEVSGGALLDEFEFCDGVDAGISSAAGSAAVPARPAKPYAAAHHPIAGKNAASRTEKSLRVQMLEGMECSFA